MQHREAEADIHPRHDWLHWAQRSGHPTGKLYCLIIILIQRSNYTPHSIPSDFAELNCHYFSGNEMFQFLISQQLFQYICERQDKWFIQILCKQWWSHSCVRRMKVVKVRLLSVLYLHCAWLMTILTWDDSFSLSQLFAWLSRCLQCCKYQLSSVLPARELCHNSVTNTYTYSR